MPRKLEVFVATKGHAFCRDAFEAMLQAIGVEPTMVDHPAAAMLLEPMAMRRFDAVLLFDMPGLRFNVPVEERPAQIEPELEFKEGFVELLRQGKGIVAMHHALAGWPAWPEYGEVLGGRFLYKPQSMRGEQRGDSGYLPNVRYIARKALDAHPVLAGLPDSFELTDELYACERFDDPDTLPLIVRETMVEGSAFSSALHAVRQPSEGERAGWRAPEPDPVLAWAKPALASPLVYLQPGDGPAVYENENFRLLLGNALRWVASPEARHWVSEQG